jgi:asparagine synthase (glutamine-hydrolysing)
MRNQLLRDADWAGMAHGLEIRVPLVDFKLLKNLASVLQEKQSQHVKYLLALAPKTKLPSVVVQRMKTGFTVPIEQWLQGDELVKDFRSLSFLNGCGSHWSRRWAYNVMQATAGNYKQPDLAIKNLYA